MSASNHETSGLSNAETLAQLVKAANFRGKPPIILLGKHPDASVIDLERSQLDLYGKKFRFLNEGPRLTRKHAEVIAIVHGIGLVEEGQLDLAAVYEDEGRHFADIINSETFHSLAFQTGAPFDIYAENGHDSGR